MSDWLQRISPHAHIVGSMRQQMQYLDPRRVLYDHELMLFGEGGQCELVFSERRLEFGSNSFVIIPPGVWHVSRGLEGCAVSRAWVHFDWSFDPRSIPWPSLTYAPARPDPERYHAAPEWLPAGLLHGAIANPISVFTLHQRLEERFNGGGRRGSSRGLLLELLLELLAPNEREGVAKNESNVVAVEIRQSLDKLAQVPFNQAPSVRDHLAQSGQSYDHQARLFKASYGVTPLQYVNSFRIEQACHLLQETSLKVGAIAEQLGYGDPVYFGRCFKKYIGKSPQAYRQCGTESAMAP